MNLLSKMSSNSTRVNAGGRVGVLPSSRSNASGVPNTHPNPTGYHPGQLTQSLRQQQRQTTGSATTTVVPDPPQEEQPALVLRLRAASATRTRRRIQWTEDTVDNEGMGKKKSKVCCIYHKPREFGESSSEEDSSDSSNSDSGSDTAARAGGPQRCGHGHHHSRRNRRNPKYSKDGDEKGDSARRRASPNAYEKMPKVHTKQDR